MAKKKAPARPAPVGDAGVKGSVVRGPREDGRWYWALRVTIEGKRKKIESGWWTREEAALKCAEHAAARTKDRLALGPIEEGDIRTVQDLVETYGANIEGQVKTGQASRHTLKEADRCRRRWVERYGHLPLAHVTTATLASFRDARLREGIAASTVDAELTHLCGAWRWALRLQAIRLPVPERPRLHVPEFEREHTPDAEEVAAVLAWLRSWEGDAKPDAQRPGRERNRRALQVRVARRTADVLELQAIYGARIGEVSSLTVGAVGADRITFRGKTGTRTLPLADEARPILGRWLDGRDPGAWLWRATPATVERYAWRELARAREALGQPAWTPHALRAGWSDDAEADGVSLLRIAAWLGNSPVVVARHYRRVRARELDTVAEELGLVSNVRPLSRRRRQDGEDD